MFLLSSGLKFDNSDFCIHICLEFEIMTAWDWSDQERKCKKKIMHTHIFVNDLKKKCFVFAACCSNSKVR